MKCPDCERQMTGVEYAHNHPQHYDGVSEWYCPICRIRIGRWSGKRLAGGEAELRYAKPAVAARAAEKMGVCCECQMSFPVRRHQDAIECDLWEEDLADIGVPPENIYVMDLHEPFGRTCAGTGTVPQALVRSPIHA